MIWMIWIPASVFVGISYATPDYGDADVYGVKWKPEYAEFTLVMKNSSANNFTNIDLDLMTDVLIVDAGIKPGINACAAEPWAASPWSDIRIKPGAKPWMPITRPLSTTYRIHC
jgi:hypothetical protein